MANLVGPSCIIQSDFGLGDHKNFEAVLFADGRLEHLFASGGDWQRGGTISTRATGPGCIIQSDFGLGDHKNFEVVVLEGNELVHYFHENADMGLPWQRGKTISTRATGPGCIIQSDFGLGDHKNFEVVVLEGNELVHYFHENADMSLRWERGKVVSVAATGPGCITKNTLDPGRPREFQVLASELTKSVVHYTHRNVHVEFPWWRLGVLPGFGEDRVDSPDIHRTIKVAQLTGQSTLSQTKTQFGVVGTDLGQSFEHEGRVVFLFGDTITDNKIRVDPFRDLDSIAFSADEDASKGIRLQFNPTHPHVDNVDQTTMCVPADGISLRGNMCVFFTTDHVHEDPRFDSMGRSVLARSEDNGLNFGSPLYELSRDKFINVSLQLVTNGDFPGLPDREGQGVLLFGSGGYRRSNVYLAYIPLDRLEDRSALLYFAGLDNEHRPRWAREEALAQPLLLSGSVGELCVRWNPFLRRFILLYNGDNPRFILEHQSRLPWGPWTGPQNIFDLDAAYGDYIHRAGSRDGLNNPGPPHFEDESGNAYGPYLINRYTRPSQDGSTTMFFVLSVWNPYNTMLMSAIVRTRDLGQAAQGGNFIQSNFGRQGNFELVVPLGNRLAHYFRDNDAPGSPWRGPLVVFDGSGSGPQAVPRTPTAVSLIQSNFVTPGNLELIVRLSRLGEDRLVFFFRDAAGWHGPFDVVADGQPITGVTGNPALIQSNFGRQGNFELVVPLGNRLAHYFRDNDAPGLPWHGPFVFFDSTPPQSSGVHDPVPFSPTAASLLQSNFVTPGNLELIVRLFSPTRGEDKLVFFFRDKAGWHGPLDIMADGSLITGVTGF